VARGAGGTLSSSTVGALPILNQILKRMKLEEFLRAYLPREDGRTKLSAARADKIERALGHLAELREKLRSPRTRYQQKAKVEKAVDEIFQSCGARRCMVVRIEERQQESYRQEKPGRPAKNTRYVKRVKRRFDLL